MSVFLEWAFHALGGKVESFARFQCTQLHAVHPTSVPNRDLPGVLFSPKTNIFLNYKFVAVHSSAATGHFEHSLDVSTLHNSQNCA